jgi:uncharacterized membrane protein
VSAPQTPGERRAEARWPVVLAIVVLIVLYAVTPSTLVPKNLVEILIVVLFVPLFALNPRRLNRQTRWSRWLSIALALVLTVGNLVDVGWIIHALISGADKGLPVLLAAVQVWVGCVVAFGLVYWELDRGGPVARGTLPRAHLPAADFRFTQDDADKTVAEVRRDSSIVGDWRPAFIDYLYMSLTNMMAFSPTDVMPLTTRAKLLMMLQSLIGFVLLALVIARSVNILA